ncbi:alanyl-tRNA editing protein Aarsd1-B [Ischnura elegans]|uniref:alanyl-tRNA editing protein Aarsd1-B n=1 Tax=Ischnura elegans TaxID=197161 RepID=UPI001ED87E77|nr:alanyl-tRNA editing protein Aarsd1-B [Ischnura elegans]
MILCCQRDSFKTEFTTKVKSCKEVAASIPVGGKKETIQAYEVLLEDSVLFPEGGGQPSDHGWIDEEEVLVIERRGEDVVHTMKKPFSVGQDVKQKVDWDLRFDRMQQHTGQHLITAIADKQFKYSTTSWWLGDKVCHIELESASGNVMTDAEMKDLERVVNEKIREATPISVNVYEEGDPHLTTVRTRGLPDGFKGPVRVVTITGVEDNMCCGTHLKHLGQLQAIKLLSVERGKARGGKPNRSFFLYFLAGGRVLSRLDESLQRESQLTALLKNSPADHVDLVDKLQKSYKQCSKNLQSVLRNVAVMEAEKFKVLEPKPKFYSLHRKEAEPDFMSVFLTEVGSQDTLFFLSVGDPNGSGNMILFGDSKILEKLGPIVCEILGGKGAGKGQRFQAKVSNLKRRPDAEAAIEQFLTTPVTDANEL